MSSINANDITSINATITNLNVQTINGIPASKFGNCCSCKDIYTQECEPEPEYDDCECPDCISNNNCNCYCHGGAQGLQGAQVLQVAQGIQGAQGAQGEPGASGTITDQLPSVVFGTVVNTSSNIYIPLIYPTQTYTDSFPQAFPTILGCKFILSYYNGSTINSTIADS